MPKTITKESLYHFSLEMNRKILDSFCQLLSDAFLFKKKLRIVFTPFYFSNYNSDNSMNLQMKGSFKK